MSNISFQNLTPRQLEVITVIAQGHSDKQASKLLSISANAIKRHVYRSCERLQLMNRIQLVVAFAKWQERQTILMMLDPSRTP
jgi:DNA-binding NarL/FixJ family response regulator